MKILRVKQQDGTLVDIPFGVSNSSSDITTHNTDASAHSDIRNAIAELENTVDGITVPTKLSALSDDATHRLVTDTEKSTWNAKANTSDIPTKVSQLTNDKGYITNVPITSVNGKTGAVEINIADIDNLQKALDDRADKSQGIFYIEGDASSSTDTTNKVATWIGSHDEITSYFNGLTILYKVVTAGSTSTTLNINGLGAVTVVRNATTGISTACPVDGVLMLTYTVDSNGTAYWKTADYDANTKNTAGTSNKTGSKMYLVGATSQTSSGTTTYSNSNVYINTSNQLYSAKGFSGNLIGNANTATKATQDANGNDIVSTYVTKSDLDTIKEEIKLAVIDAFGGQPVVGYIDGNNNIILTTSLANGTYMAKYEMSDGGTIDIGSLTLGVVSYSITRNLVNCSVSVQSHSGAITAGEAYTATIISTSGYIMNMATIKVTMGGLDITASTVSEVDSTVRINIPNVTGDIVVTATAIEEVVEPTYYSITRNLTNCTINNTTESIVNNSSYSATITAATGYTLSNVVVTMGGVNVPVTNGVINITNVMGDIVITAKATIISYTIVNNLTNCTTNNTAASITYGSTYSATITANSGYELESVTATMGGSDISVSSGVISIASVTGNIVITAKAKEQLVEAQYTNLFDPSASDTYINSRVKSDGSIVEQTGYIVTNRMDIKSYAGIGRDVKIYIKGAIFDTSSSQSSLKVYTSKPSASSATYDNTYSSVTGASLSSTNEGHGVMSYVATKPNFPSNIQYMVLVLKVSDTTITTDDIQDIVITLDEPIYL